MPSITIPGSPTPSEEEYVARQQSQIESLLSDLTTGAVAARAENLQQHLLDQLISMREASPNAVRKEDASNVATPRLLDPRWDVSGFNQAAEACRCAWVRVGYLRELKELGKPVPYQQLAPDGALWIGAPPPDVQLYAISPYTWIGEKRGHSEGFWKRQPTHDERVHSDPNGFILNYMVEYLNQDGAFDDDLVVFLHISARCFAPTEGDEAVACLQRDSAPTSTRTTASSACQCLERARGYEGDSVIKRLWGIHEFFLAAYCQRIVNSSSPLVKPNLTPEKLRSAQALLETAPTYSEYNRELILRKRRETLSRMPPARDDAVGFQTVCEQAGFRWIRVWFIQELASRGGPAPRCQDLPYGAYAEGRVPEGQRHYVVSHGWAAHLHFDPSGGKLRDLVAVLTRLGAAPNDVVFVDFMSLTQAGGWVPKTYLSFNQVARRHVVEEDGEMVKLSGRTDKQERRFRFALFETTRLYAYLPSTGPTVIVLPHIEPPESFPEPGTITWEDNTVCQPPRKEQKSAWGFSKSIAYENAGWPCAEYAVSRMNNTIANSEDVAVRQVEDARAWPEDVDSYAALMDEEAATPVAFTKKGDREAVRFNFYKYSFNVTE